MSERIRGSYDDALYKSTYWCIQQSAELLDVALLAAACCPWWVTLRHGVTNHDK